MGKNVDISDLLKVDNRLGFNWRHAEVKNGELNLQFPNKGYSVVEGESVVKGNIWELYVRTSNIANCMIHEQSIKIPKGVTKIVYGKIE